MADPLRRGGEARASDRQVVDVTAQQFAWVVDPIVVRAGRQVEFRLRATDVAHGFGLYDPDDKLFFQVQAGPGELQKEFQTLHKPGYRINCLEFCGVGHHLMLNELTVQWHIWLTVVFGTSTPRSGSGRGSRARRGAGTTPPRRPYSS